MKEILKLAQLGLNHLVSSCDKLMGALQKFHPQYTIILHNVMVHYAHHGMLVKFVLFLKKDLHYDLMILLF